MTNGRRAGIAIVLVAVLALVAWLATRGGSDSPRREPHVPLRVVAASPIPVLDERELRGRVIDPAGAPVSGAVVAARRGVLQGVDHRDAAEHGMREGTPVARATTGEDGAFALPLPPARAHDLRVTAAGFAVEDVPDRYAGEDVTVRLAAPAGVRGRLTRKEDGSPLAAAPVRVWRTSREPRAARGTETDADGRFAFTDLSPGEYRLEATPMTALAMIRTIRVTEGSVVEKNATLERGVAVSGRVTSAATGEPIEGAEIGEGRLFRRAVRTDADGRYVFPAFGGSGDLHVRAPGFGAAEWWGPGPARVPLVADFALEAASRVTGRVVDDRGEPVAGAYVAAFGGGPSAKREKSEWLSSTSGPDGAFAIADVRADVVRRLFVRRDGYGSRVRELSPGELLSSPRIDLGDVTIAAEAIVAGSVVDETGRPVAGHVTVRRAIPGEPISVEPAQPLAVRVDGAGRFRVSALEAGTYRLRFRGTLDDDSPDAGKPIDEVVTVRDGEKRDGVRIVRWAEHSITGFVVDADDEPVVGAILSFRSTTSPGDSPPRDAFTGGTGAFTVDGLRAGTYEISVSPRSALGSHSSATTRLTHWRVAVVEAGARDVRVEIPRSSRVSGVVLEATGEWSHRPLVEVLAPDGARISATAGGWNGRFTVEAPEGARFTLKATAPTLEAVIDGRPDLVYELFVTMDGVAAGATDVVLKLPPRP